VLERFENPVPNSKSETLSGYLYRAKILLGVAFAGSNALKEASLLATIAKGAMYLEFGEVDQVAAADDAQRIETLAGENLTVRCQLS
jgi:hypothetical protein